jgi:hypothetical protein
MGLPLRWDECYTPEPEIAPQPEPQSEPRRRASRSLRRQRFWGTLTLFGMLGATAGVAASGIQHTFRSQPALILDSRAGATYTLSETTVNRQAGYVDVAGTFENTQNVPRRQVEAVVELLDKDNNPIGMESAMISRETVPARASSAFHVLVPDIKQAVACRVHFRHLLGETIE